MKVTLQNVGGITNPETIELQEGLNVIRAPNATGKTSFTHGLKLSSMDNIELKDHPEFINDFSDKAIVTIDNKTREIKRQGGFPLSKEAPIYRMNGRSGIMFANPEKREKHFNSQLKPKRYAFAGYLSFKVKTLLEQNNIWGKRSYPIIVKEIEAFDIDTENDFKYATIINKYIL